MEWLLQNRPDLALLVFHWGVEGHDEKRLLCLLRGHRIKRVLKRMLDENEFLSPFGIRPLSKYHEKNPFSFQTNAKPLTVRYVPGDSDSDMFGGNSNWQGPIWIPVNYLIIKSLRRFHSYFSNDFTVEFPTNSGIYLSLDEIANELARRLLRLFIESSDNNREFGDEDHKYILFHEYFHGESGKGLGASHQTGWTALVANLIQESAKNVSTVTPT